MEVGGAGWRGGQGRRAAAQIISHGLGLDGDRTHTWRAVLLPPLLSVPRQRSRAEGRRGQGRPKVAQDHPRARPLSGPPPPPPRVGASPASPAQPNQLRGSFLPRGAGLGARRHSARPLARDREGRGGAREVAGGDLDSDPSPVPCPPPPRRPGPAEPPVPPSPQGLRRPQVRWAGLRFRGKRSGEPGMKAERAGESRAELASLARSLAGSRPPSAPPPPARVAVLPRPWPQPLAAGEPAGAPGPGAPVGSASASRARSPSAASR